MEPFKVYSLFDVTPVKAKGCYLWDEKGTRYLDLYGGHAVISIGHSHPHYIAKLTEQLNKIGFYSNSIKNPLQYEMAEKLGKLSGMEDYQLFLINSGAEANENAMKLASFITGRSEILSFSKCFHGRTSGAVAVTDIPKIIAPINRTSNAILTPFNDLNAAEEKLKTKKIAAVIIEGIQGVGGIHVPEPSFLEGLGDLCKKHGTFLILDEVQSGYGRSGKFFSFQHSNVKPDLITTAKGMADGFPMGSVLIRPDIKPWTGMLGTTFGGNYLACAAAIAVLDVMKDENLVENARVIGNLLLEKLKEFPQIKEVRGKGLMIGLEFDKPIKAIREKLLYEEHIFTGAAGPNVLRLLPPLILSEEQALFFIEKFSKVLNECY
ncbi:MAG: aspartate aminotransferase family protein [Prolixibacteraceae bacterium]|nr:aspartate aminotransferase family protein [Prolixibacteraceae bacterium]